MKNELGKFSFWMHFPSADKTNNPEIISKAHINFFRKYKLDFLKFSPHGLYLAEAFGATMKYPKGKIPLMVEIPVLENPLVNNYEDWGKINKLNLNENEAIQIQIKALSITRKHVNVPIIQTVYSPLTIAKKLSGNGIIFMHLKEYPKFVKKSLEAIAKSLEEYIKILSEMDIGIFYANQIDGIENYGEFLKYDLEILKGIEFGINHIHGYSSDFKSLLKLPMDIVSWESKTIKVEEINSKIPLQGVDRESVYNGDFSRIKSDIENILKKREDAVIGPNCILDHRTPEKYLVQLSKMLKDIMSKR